VQRERVKVRKAYKEKGVAHQRMSRMNTKWARYDHRHAPQNAARMQDFLDAHSSSQFHKCAREVLLSPESQFARAPALEPDAEAACSAEAETAACSAETETADRSAETTTAACSAVPTARGANLIATVDLFKGRVPQVQEWLEAWAECSSSVSYLKQAKMKRKRGQGGTLSGHRFQLHKWQA
jgi:hypothetical protein